MIDCQLTRNGCNRVIWRSRDDVRRHNVGGSDRHNDTF
jgi:hypothetical protein